MARQRESRRAADEIGTDLRLHDRQHVTRIDQFQPHARHRSGEGLTVQAGRKDPILPSEQYADR